MKNNLSEPKIDRNLPAIIAGNKHLDQTIPVGMVITASTVHQSKEFDKIAAIPGVYLGHENKTLGGIKSCAIPVPCEDKDLPNVLKFAKLWKPVDENQEELERLRARVAKLD